MSNTKECKTETLTPTRVTPSLKKRMERAMVEMGVMTYSGIIVPAIERYVTEIEDEFNLSSYPKDEGGE